MLLLHPFSEAAIGRLASQHRVLYLPGVPDALVDEPMAATVLDEAGVPSAIVVGQEVAVQLAARRPARVAALVLLQPSVVGGRILPSLRLPTLIVVAELGSGRALLRTVAGAELAVAEEAGWPEAILAFTANL